MFKTMDTKALGAAIRKLRKAAGMTQMDLAEHLDVSYQQVQKYENGKNRVSVPTLLKLSEIFGIPVNAFLAEAAPGVNPQFTVAETRLVMMYRQLKDDSQKQLFEALLAMMVKRGK